MGYTPSFTPQYENGWENLPLETTPITAEAFNAYDDAIENIEEYLASDESQANLADAYDETATYEAGDYVIYGGDLYKCLEDIDTPEEWDSTKWESCLITDEMATSGGTTVIANPEGEATETLTKLQVEETIYGVSGGGGSANIWEGTQAELEEEFDNIPNETAIIITDDEQEVVEGGTIYSEEEQVIGLWTDNRPLYQKTLVTESDVTVTTSGTWVSSGLSAPSGAQVVKGELVNEYLVGIIGVFVNSSTGEIKFSNIPKTGNITIPTGTKFTITYTKSTDAPLDAVVGKKTMYIASSDCYSTEEKEVGCHTDGKPIYQRTFVLSSDLTCASNSWTYTGIETLDADFIVSHKCQASNGTNWGAIEVNVETVNNVRQFGILNTRNSNIAVRYLTVQYTKTTDTAGSGQYTPASGKAVHYSTDEQVIGTWIDGSTLYRKTLTGNLTPSGTSYNEIVGTLSALGATLVTKAEGFLQNTLEGGLYKMSIPSYVNSTNASGVYISGVGDIRLYVTGTYHKYYLTLEYIK